jgi:transcriptional regulator with XRE-family HTH domain
MDRMETTALARMVKTRREELGLTVEQALARIPETKRPSTSGWRNIEQGITRHPMPKMVDAISIALDVPSQTVRLWAAGDDSVQVPQPSEVQADFDLVAISRRLQEIADQATTPVLSGTDYVVGVLNLLNDDQLGCVFAAVDRLRGP